jgi:hypothetical protein
MSSNPAARQAFLGMADTWTEMAKAVEAKQQIGLGLQSHREADGSKAA